MHFAKTLFIAILGLGAVAFAAPVEATTAVNAAPADVCDRIDNPDRRRECERGEREKKAGREKECEAFRGRDRRDRPNYCN